MTITTTGLPLARRFKASEVSTRPGAGKTLHFIDIIATIKRLQETGWDFVVTSTSMQEAGGSYLATVSGTLTINGASRSGTGASKQADPDDAIKTAQAEALKKAGHLFGIGLQHWDQRENDLVDLVKAGKFKRAVALLATIDYDLAEPDPLVIEEFYGEDPTTDDGAAAILTDAGLL